MEYEHILLDAGSACVVYALVNAIKPYVMNRFIPLIPLVVAMPLGALVVFVNVGFSGLLPFLAESALEGLKIAAVAMISFKLWHTTVMGR